MFQVKIAIADDQIALSDRMEAMRIWLDERRCEPTLFRYAFAHHLTVCRVDFPAEVDALEFANAFDGELMGGSAAAI